MRSRHDLHDHAIQCPGDTDDGSALHIGVNNRWTSTDTENDLSGKHGLEQLRRPANINEVDLESVFVEIAPFFCGPNPRHGAAHGRVAGPHPLLLCTTDRRDKQDEYN